MTVLLISYYCKSSAILMICDLPLAVQIKLWFFWRVWVLSLISMKPACQPLQLKSFTSFMSASNCENQHETEEEGGSMGGEDWVRPLVNTVCPLIIGIWYLTSSSLFISCPKRGPLGKSLSYSRRRDSYSHSVQGFHSKICLHIAHTNVEIPSTEVHSTDLNNF